MPIAVARQIQFWLEELEIDVEISVDWTTLTEAQCDLYDLPRSPIKKKTSGGPSSNFSTARARPSSTLWQQVTGELEKIIREAVKPFTDRELRRRLDQTWTQIHADGGPYYQPYQEWVDRGGPWLENRMRDLAEDANGIAAEGAEQVRVIVERMREAVLQAKSKLSRWSSRPGSGCKSSTRPPKR